MLNRAQIEEVAGAMGHRLSTAEVVAVETVCRLGNEFGYGNLIGWLSTAWAMLLIKTYGIEESIAREAVHGTPYPLPPKVLG